MPTDDQDHCPQRGEERQGRRTVPDNYVNGVTGATLTSNGVNNMIQKCLNDYQDILESLKK